MHSVPRVSLLYTLLNLTGMDVTLGGRATVECELDSRRKVGHHALHWITLILLSERVQHPSVFFSPVTYS